MSRKDKSIKSDMDGAGAEMPHLLYYFNGELISDPHPHMTSTNSGRFACPHCDIRQQSSAALRNHLRVHTGERPFQCDICFKCFKMPHHLRDHLHTHSGDRPYGCDYCEKRFIQRSNLRHHLQTVHQDENHFPCSFCPESFPSKRQLKVHQLETMHMSKRTMSRATRIPLESEQIYSCNFCPLKFRREDSRNIHERNHVLETDDEDCFDFVESDAQVIRSSDLSQMEMEEMDPDEVLSEAIEHQSASKSAIEYVEAVLDTKPSVENIALEKCYNDDKDQDQPVIHDVKSNQVKLETITEQIEIDGKEYKCNHCPRTFARCSALKAHENRMHIKIIEKAQKAEEAFYACKIQDCLKKFKTEASLRNHQGSHQREEPQAPNVTNVFQQSKGQLRKLITPSPSPPQPLNVEVTNSIAPAPVRLLKPVRPAANPSPILESLMKPQMRKQSNFVSEFLTLQSRKSSPNLLRRNVLPQKQRPSLTAQVISKLENPQTKKASEINTEKTSCKFCQNGVTSSNGVPCSRCGQKFRAQGFVTPVKCQDLSSVVLSNPYGFVTNCYSLQDKEAVQKFSQERYPEKNLKAGARGISNDQDIILGL